MVSTNDINLSSQMNAAVHMLDLIDNYLILFTVYASLGVQYFGLLHSVCFAQHGLARQTGVSIKSKECPPTLINKIFFPARVMISISILTIALAITIQALLEGKRGKWEGIPLSATVFFLLCYVF